MRLRTGLKAMVVPSVVVVFTSFTQQIVPARLKSFEQLDE